MAALYMTLQIAWHNLTTHRRRTLLLGSAIATVTYLFILLAALSAGIEHTLTDAAVLISTGHINVNGIVKVSEGRAAPLLMDYRKVSAIIAKTVPEAEFVVARGRGAGRLIADDATADAVLNGVDMEAEPELKNVLRIIDGDVRQVEQGNSLLLFEKEARLLGVKVGDAVTISTETVRGVANTLDCRVAAIAHNVGLLSTGNAFMSFDTMRELYQVRPEATGVLQIHIRAEYLDRLPRIESRLRAALEKAGYGMLSHEPGPFFSNLEPATRESWTGEKLDVDSWEDEVSFLMWPSHALRWFSGLLIMMLLGVIIVGVMNSLWIATRERTREIGALRAMGAQKWLVTWLFVCEAGLLGVLGATSGDVLGVLMALAVNRARIEVPLTVQLFVMRDTLQLAPQPSALIIAIGMMTGSACIAALYPALRAAHRRPVETMGYGGA